MTKKRDYTEYGEVPRIKIRDEAQREVIRRWAAKIRENEKLAEAKGIKLKPGENQGVFLHPDVRKSGKRREGLMVYLTAEQRHQMKELRNHTPLRLAELVGGRVVQALLEASGFIPFVAPFAEPLVDAAVIGVSQYLSVHAEHKATQSDLPHITPRLGHHVASVAFSLVPAVNILLPTIPFSWVNSGVAKQGRIFVEDDQLPAEFEQTHTMQQVTDQGEGTLGN